MATGAPQSERTTFEFVGGALCLDFVNTGSNWRSTGRGLPTAGTERLDDYGDFVAWARQGGAVSDAMAAALRAAAEAAPEEVERTLRRARRFRAALQAAFTAAMTGDPVPGNVLAEVNREVGALLGASRLVPDDGGYRLGHPGERDLANPALDAPLWAVARSAIDVLTTPDLGIVHACASESCGWLFLDRTGRRRWCSMASCGTTAKVRRYRSRHAHGDGESARRQDGESHGVDETASRQVSMSPGQDEDPSA